METVMMMRLIALAAAMAFVSSQAAADHYAHADTFEGKAAEAYADGDFDKAQKFEEQHFKLYDRTRPAYEGTSGSLGKKSQYHCCDAKEPQGQGGGYFGSAAGSDRNGSAD